MTALTRGRVISLADQDARPPPRERREPAALSHIAHEDLVAVAAELAVEHKQKLLELATLRARVLERAEADITQIARLLAERIIGEELALDPGKLVLMARQALREVGGATQVKILAAPGAVEELRHEMSQFEFSRAVRIEIVSDASLGPGDLRLETDVGSIDARVGTQLTHLAAAAFESNRS